jgi:hypothetical protein
MSGSGRKRTVGGTALFAPVKKRFDRPGGTRYHVSVGGKGFDMEEHEPVEIPIDGVLDLHAFHPSAVKELIPDYIAECRRRGVLQVRIIHGKGAGILRERVHSILRRLDAVRSFRLAGDEAGGWGATIVLLHPEEDHSPTRE